jgi:oligopeptide transport system substrate-binding protein
MNRYVIALRTVAAAALALLAACSPSGNSHTVHAPDYLVRGNGSEIKSLDPHYIDGQWEANVVGDMLVGLTTDGPDGKPIPGAATSWETSPDGKTWTFHIRDHVWSDGVPVTAGDFVYAWRRILEPARGAPYAYYLWLIQNAHEISEGKLPPSALGVSAPDDKTLVVHLVHPAPYMLEYLLHQAVFPVPRHVVEKLGNAWAKPQNYVANGPYIPKEWVANDHITLVKNPKFYDAGNVRIGTIIYKPSQDALAALEWIRSGELDTQNILASSEIGWMRRHIPRALQIRTYLGVSYVTPNIRRKPFDDVRVREAIALTMNREVVTHNILRIGQPPAYSFVPPGIANYPGGAAFRFRALPYEARIARAQQLMRQAGYGPGNLLQTTYSTIPTPDAKRTSALLQFLLKKIYIDAKVDQTDTQIFYKKLQEGQFDIASSAWIGDFDDATTFLDLLRSDSGNNYGGYKSAKFDALMKAADNAADLRARGEFLKQAEQTALDDYAVLPNLIQVTQDIVEPYVKGWVPNVRDFNRSRWLWIDPHARPERGGE